MHSIIISKISIPRFNRERILYSLLKQKRHYIHCEEANQARQSFIARSRPLSCTQLFEKLTIFFSLIHADRIMHRILDHPPQTQSFCNHSDCGLPFEHLSNVDKACHRFRTFSRCCDDCRAPPAGTAAIIPVYCAAASDSQQNLQEQKFDCRQNCLCQTIVESSFSGLSVPGRFDRRLRVCVWPRRPGRRPRRSVTVATGGAAQPETPGRNLNAEAAALGHHAQWPLPTRSQSHRRCQPECVIIWHGCSGPRAGGGLSRHESARRNPCR